MIATADCLSLEDARGLVPEPGDALVSIADPSFGADLGLDSWPADRILGLRFDDVILELFEEAPVYVLFDLEMARRVVDFARRLHALPEPIRLYVHCIAGVSRSAAVVYWLHRDFGVELPKGFGWRACPNARVLDFLIRASSHA